MVQSFPIFKLTPTIMRSKSLSILSFATKSLAGPFSCPLMNGFPFADDALL